MANYKNIKAANAEIERLRQLQVPKESCWKSRALYVALGFVTGILACWSFWIAVAFLAVGSLVWLFRANWIANVEEARSVFDRHGVSNGRRKVAAGKRRVGEVLKDWGALDYVLTVTLLGAIIGAWLGSAIWASPDWRNTLIGAIVGLWSGATLILVFALGKEKS